MSIGFRRRALSAWLALALFVLTSCANVQPHQVIIAWHTLSGARERAFLQLVDRWNRTNRDGIVIVPERREPAAQHRALLAGATSGVLPDLALVQPAEAALYAQRGLLAALDPFISSDDPAIAWDAADQADLFPFIQQAGRTPQGQLIGAPFGGELHVLLVNRDWMSSLGQAEMPADWEAFDKLCDGATDRIVATACFGFDPNAPSVIEDWLYAHGAPVYDPATQQMRIATTEAASAIASLLSYLQSGRAYLAISPERNRDDFVVARTLFISIGSDQLDEVARAVRERANFGLDAGTFPSAMNVPTASIRAPLWVALKRTTDRERAAWKFINWLLATEQTAEWAVETAEIPARLSALAVMGLSPEQPSDALRMGVLRRVVPTARPVPLVSGWPCVQSELSNVMRQIIEGRVVEEALLLAQTRAQELLNADCALQ